MASSAACCRSAVGRVLSVRAAEMAVTDVLIVIELLFTGGVVSAFAPVVRTFRIARALRLVRSAKGLQMVFKP